MPTTVDGRAPITAPVLGLDKFTTKFRNPSCNRLLETGMVIVAFVCPVAKLITPDFAV